jgi:hypothetical protein
VHQHYVVLQNSRPHNHPASSIDLYEDRPPTNSHTYQRGDYPKRRTTHAVERAHPPTEGGRVGDGDRRLAGQFRVFRGHSAQEGGQHRADLAHACYYAGVVSCGE